MNGGEAVAFRYVAYSFSDRTGSQLIYFWSDWWEVNRGDVRELYCAIMSNSTCIVNRLSVAGEVEERNQIHASQHCHTRPLTGDGVIGLDGGHCRLLKVSLVSAWYAETGSKSSSNRRNLDYT